MIKPALVLTLLSSFLLHGCGDMPEPVLDMADATQGAAQRLFERADEASRAREARVLAGAEELESRTRTSAALVTLRDDRYEIRKDGMGDSYAVFDTVEGKIVTVGSRRQSGLSHADAEAAFGDLVKAESLRAPVLPNSP